MDDDNSFETQLIHAGPAPDPAYGAVVPPIYLSSTYQQRAVGEHQGFDYSRTANPTRSALESTLATLEGGVRGLAYASGMAAIGAATRSCWWPWTIPSPPPTCSDRSSWEPTWWFTPPRSIWAATRMWSGVQSWPSMQTRPSGGRSG